MPVVNLEVRMTRGPWILKFAVGEGSGMEIEDWETLT